MGNEGTLDRAARGVLGAVLLLAMAAGWIGWWGGVIGVILLATGVVGFCPLYRIFGWSTEPAAKAK